MIRRRSGLMAGPLRRCTPCARSEGGKIETRLEHLIGTSRGQWTRDSLQTVLGGSVEERLGLWEI